MTAYWELDFGISKYEDDPRTEYCSTPPFDRILKYQEDKAIRTSISVPANTISDFYSSSQSEVKNAEVVFIKVSSPAYVRLNGSYQNIPVSPWLLLTNNLLTDEIRNLKLVNKSDESIGFEILILGSDEEFSGISNVF